MDRLLTDGEICNLLETIPSELGAGMGFVESVIKIRKAQDAKTLKAVGEWLEKDCDISGDKWAIVDRFNRYVQVFQRGEMPE